MFTSKLQLQRSKQGRSRRSLSESSAPTIPRSQSLESHKCPLTRASTAGVGKQRQGKTVEKLSTILEDVAVRLKNEHHAGDGASISPDSFGQANVWWTWLTIHGSKHNQSSERRRHSLPEEFTSASLNVAEDCSISHPDSHDRYTSPAQLKGHDNEETQSPQPRESMDDVLVSPSGVLWIPAADLAPTTPRSDVSSISSLPSPISHNLNPSFSTFATTPGQASTDKYSPGGLISTPMSLLEDEESDVVGEIVQLDATAGVGLGLNLDPVSEWTDDEDTEIPAPAAQATPAAVSDNNHSTPPATYKRSFIQTAPSSRKRRDRNDSLFWLIKHSRWRGDGTLRHEMYFRWFEENCSSIDAMVVESAIIEFEWDMPDEDEFNYLEMRGS